METVIISFYLIVFFILIKGIIRQREIGEFSQSMDDLGDDLCKFCPLEEWQKGTHGIPDGYISCEGMRCEDAYEYYLEYFDESKINNQ